MSTASTKLRHRLRREPRGKKKKEPTTELPSQLVEEHIDKLRNFVKQHKLKNSGAPMPSGRLRVFADCAGLSSETIALGLLGLTSEDVEFVGGSEIDPTKRAMMQAVHKAFGLKTEKKMWSTTFLTEIC